jgi:protein-disulfide isomerase
MFPGGGSGQYQQGDGWPGQPPQDDPNQQPGSGYGQPASGQSGYGPPVPGPPVSGQPGYQPQYQQPVSGQPGYQPSAYQPSAYQHPAYQQPAYPTPGYDQAGYGQPGYQQPYQLVLEPPQRPRSDARSHVIVVAAVAIVAMLSVVGAAVVLANTSGDEPEPPGPTTAGGSSAPADDDGDKPAPDPGTGLAVGSGPVRVDIYVDYQCPPCSTFEAATGDILSSNISSGRVTLRIHPVAFIDNRSKNIYATRAAAAAACAHDGGKTLEFHNYLLEHQPPEDTAGPTDEELARAGATVGLGAGFATCVTGGKRVAWVAQATAAAQNHGVTSVPAAYVNDKKIDATKADLVNAITNA